MGMTEDAGMTSIGVAWSKGSWTADPEPEPPLGAMQPCILKPGPPLTLAVHLYTHAVPPRCRHSRPLTHRNARTCTSLLTHSRQGDHSQGDEEGSGGGREGRGVSKAVTGNGRKR